MVPVSRLEQAQRANGELRQILQAMQDRTLTEDEDDSEDNEHEEEKTEATIGSSSCLQDGSSQASAAASAPSNGPVAGPAAAASAEGTPQKSSAPGSPLASSPRSVRLQAAKLKR